MLFRSLIIGGAILIAIVMHGSKKIDQDKYRSYWLKIENSLQRDQEASYSPWRLTAKSVRTMGCYRRVWFYRKSLPLRRNYYRSRRRDYFNISRSLIFNLNTRRKMKVILAEKPSVAREIAAIVGASEKQDGYLLGNDYAVT